MKIFFSIALFLLAVSVNSESAIERRTIPAFNVLNFGAIGDGIHDDTRAFLNAWHATCTAATGTPTLVVPKGMSFLLRSIDFAGPCTAKNIIVQIAGTIVAPISPKEWGGAVTIRKWISFKKVHGLIVEGGGVINGRGKLWWENSCSSDHLRNRPGCSKHQPHAINFVKTSNGFLKDITVRNSPMFHVTLLDLNNFEVQNIRVDSPENSPNTDGLHTQNVKHVNITNSAFRSGDDCVSIGNSSSHVYIRDCHCGPGHGVSIGSLGEDGHLAEVNNIHVERVNFYGTMNGVRIKTWQDGKGECHSVSFKNCNFTNVMNPLIIDQHYFSKSPKEVSAVKIFNITYEDLKGTVDLRTPSAISLRCSNLVACTGLRFRNIRFKPTELTTNLISTCNNARGKVVGRTDPPLRCLIGK
ncbi:hypothetical protein MKW98_017187 [Papaver atlanticum]|uniref:Polygalacturonase n=1 Tax=Papaver atlanticum TaxID=357466 RepID=A0AAD4SAW3_9MAGN|nr:hypothetical protein MKW98_017187 [Papaver atlanticum]